MASSRQYACPACLAVYSRSTSLRRHALSAHQLGWVGGELVQLTPSVLYEQQQLLRLQQMSAGTRRRHWANQHDDPELRPIDFRPAQRVAAVRQLYDWDEFDPIANGAAPYRPDEDWPTGSNPEVETSCDVGLQTEPVDVRSMPPVMYARASQTPEIGVPPLGWPNDLSIREVLDRCLSQNATGPDSLADGLYRVMVRRDPYLRARCRARCNDGHGTFGPARQTFVSA